MKRILIIAISILLTFSLVACGSIGPQGEQGPAGITPQLKVGEDNYWYVSYDNGITWANLNVKATVDNQSNIIDNQAYAIDLEKCDIGYELPVYPSCNFKFKTSRDEIVEISNFKVVLKEKNTIITQDPIDREFMWERFIVTITFEGKADVMLAGKKIWFEPLYNSTGHSYSLCSSETIVGEDGSFSFSGASAVDRYIYEFLFGKISFGERY
jgi:hypothetical protein